MLFVDLQKNLVYYFKQSNNLQKIKFISKERLNDTYNDFQEFAIYNKEFRLFIILRKSYSKGLISIYSAHENSIKKAMPIEEENSELIHVEMDLKYEFNNPEYIKEEILGIQTQNDNLYIILSSHYISLYVNQLKPFKHVISHELIFKPTPFSFTSKSSKIIVNPSQSSYIFFYRNAYFHKIIQNQFQSQQSFIVHAKQIENNLLKEYNLYLQVPAEIKTMEYEEVLEAQIQSIYKDDAKVQILLACEIQQLIVILHYEGQLENNFKFELKNKIFQTHESKNWLVPIQDSNQNHLNVAYQNSDQKYFVDTIQL